MTMNEYKFYDTSSLLLRTQDLFDIDENVVISSITLTELEDIKVSANKDADIKYAARHLLHLLDENPNKYEVWIFREDMLNPIVDKHLPINNDMRILATAIDYDNIKHPDETIFVTNDLALKNIANLFFGNDSIQSVNEDFDDDYRGYKEVMLNDLEMANLYEHMDVNHFDALINEYIIVKDSDENIVDGLVWTGEAYRHFNFDPIDSKQFGRISPKDYPQKFFADSLTHNQITLVKGPAGSGKTLLSLGYLFKLLEKHNIDKIIIFCNTIAAKHAARLGFYPGSKDEKLLDSQIGNLLISKLGDKMEVERLISDGKLVLLPMADIRGYDTTGMNAGIYISEAQNLDISLMKLALQRIGADSICIIDGDAKTQVDDINFAGANNGMKRVSKIFRNHKIYGEIELQQIYRSEIGKIAEEM